MPELPEVEVSRLGITPHLRGQQVQRLVVRQPRLRWPIPDALYQIEGQVIEHITRRAKYLLLHTQAGAAIIHLGMSGNLRVLSEASAPAKHDHVDLVLVNGSYLRYHDPRRFGAWLWQPAGVTHERLLALGPEPLSDAFHADDLWHRAQGKRVAIKVFVMNHQHVVGVGNIYANEALFMAGLDPRRAAGTVTMAEMVDLVAAIKQVLTQAIAQGGTTLKDFQQTDGKPGYFAQSLSVYGKAGTPCPHCTTTLEAVNLGQRATTYCPQCQS